MDLLKVLAAPWISQSLYVLAKLDIPEALADGPKTPDELDGDADALRRFLRAAAMAGVVTEDDGRFALTPTGQFLRGDVPGSQKWSCASS